MASLTEVGQYMAETFGERDDKASRKLLIRLQMALPGYYLSDDEVDVYQGKQAIVGLTTLNALLSEYEKLMSEKMKP